LKILAKSKDKSDCNGVIRNAISPRSLARSSSGSVCSPTRPKPKRKVGGARNAEGAIVVSFAVEAWQGDLDADAVKEFIPKAAFGAVLVSSVLRKIKPNVMTGAPD
jgi:hypothetical protein